MASLFSPFNDQPVTDVREVLLTVTSHGSEMKIRRHSRDGDVDEWNDFQFPITTSYIRARKVS